MTIHNQTKGRMVKVTRRDPAAAAAYAAARKIASNLQFNEQGALLLSSDQYRDADGKPTGVFKWKIELVGRDGKANVRP